MATHHIDPDYTRVRRGQQLAACWKFVDPEQDSSEPTCPVCKAKLDGELADLRALMETQFEPTPTTLNTFESTRGYVPKGQRRTR